MPEWRAITPKGRPGRKMRDLQRQLVGMMGGFVVTCQGDLQVYPPQRATTKYRRTGTLGRSWSHSVKQKPDAIEGIVGSQGQIAPYNVNVQGQRQKASAKAAGWKTAKQVLERRWPPFVKEVTSAVNRVAR